MPTPSAVAHAYAHLSRLGDAAAMTKGPGDTATGPSFGNVLKDAMASLTKTARNSDAQAVALANGKANIVDVVTAVAETEVAIDTLVSVRDRVIASYEEIMKMPI
jgi:flagellar hook-basal body complex protein FliE